MVAANRQANNQGQDNRGNQGNNPSTSPEEIDAAARQAGVVTVRMIAEELGVSEATVRSRMQKHEGEIQPVAKIHPRGRGRFTPAFDRSVIELLGAEVAEVRVERIDQGGQGGQGGGQGGGGGNQGGGNRT